MPEPATEIRDLSGSRIERFVIQARLGSGGMGEVFLARDTVLKRRVAIKAIRADRSRDANFRKRLLREAERASQLNDEHVARIYDVLEHEGRTFVVMEYVEGETLRGRMDKPISAEQFFNIAEQCLAGLSAAHACGILHCDLKPENIMISPSGVVKILDFGLACRSARPGTRESFTTVTSGPIGGTIGYAAPEVLMGQMPEPSADIFSLGVILYETLTGTHPFRAVSNPEDAAGVHGGKPRPIRRPVLAGLDAVILRMLAKDPAQRFQNCSEVLAGLRAVRDGRKLAWPKTVRAVQRNSVNYVISLMAVIILLFLSWPTRTPSHDPSVRLLAVLPFQAADPNDADTAALAHGLTATLTARLGEFAEHNNLQITVPVSRVPMQKATTAAEARSVLGATLALEGALQPSGHTLRVTYGLIDTATLQQLRSGVISDNTSNVFELQNRVIGEVLNSLDIELAAEDLRRMRARGTREIHAYEWYVRGYGYLHVYDRPENLDDAIAAFQAALQSDAHFALAWAGLGQAFLLKTARTPEEVAQARHACSQSVELDRNLADGEICMGMLFNSTGEYEEAARYLERAVELDQSSDEALQELARAYDNLKRSDDAEACLKKAIALRPQYWAGHKRLGKFYYDHGRLEEAIEKFKQVVKLAPGNFSNYSNLGGIYANLGRYDEAIPLLEQSIQIRRTPAAVSNLGVAYFYAGKYEEAARTYEDAVRMGSSDYRTFGNLAEAYAQIAGKSQQSTSQYMQALKLAEQHLSVNRKNAEVMSYAALFAARLGQQPKSEQYRQQSLSLSSRNPYIEQNSALVLAEFHQDSRALVELDAALSAGLPVHEVTHNPVWRRFTANAAYKAIVAKASGKNPEN